MDTKNILIELRAERERLEQAIAALEALDSTPIAIKPQATAATTVGKRTMSASARKKIAAAQKARWAAQKRTAKPQASANETAPKKPILKSAKKRVVSPEVRQRMAEAQQKRWAKKKRAVKAAAKKAASVAPATTSVKEASKA